MTKEKNLEHRILDIKMVVKSHREYANMHKDNFQDITFILLSHLERSLEIIEELQFNNSGLEGALAASDSYVEPCKKLQSENRQLNMQWKPINTAPIGEHILFYSENAFRDGGKLTNIGIDQWDGKELLIQSIMGHNPTHWMPLPRPPVNNKNEG